jgi:hypothetical protein
MIRTLSHEERITIKRLHDQGEPTDRIIKYIFRERCYKTKNEIGEEVRRALDPRTDISGDIKHLLRERRGAF